MQNETKMRYHFTGILMAEIQINGQKNTNN